MYLFVGGAAPEPPKQEGKDGAKKAEGGAKPAVAAGATQQAPSSSSRPKKDE